MSTDAKTKKVLIRLNALVCYTYSEVVEVPADTTEFQLDALADQRYREVGAAEFSREEGYWERGSTFIEAACPEDDVARRYEISVGAAAPFAEVAR